MTKSQLERALCRATGESRHTIHRRGFHLLKAPKRRGRRRRRWRRYA